MTNSKISIGIVFYKNVSHLYYSLVSLLSQNYSGEIEYLFCDNSPNSEVEYFIKNNIDLKHKEVKFLQYKNGNHSQGQNLLIKNATGKYYFCLSFDALYENNFIKNAVNFMELKNCFFATPLILKWYFIANHSNFKNPIINKKSKIIDSLGISLDKNFEFFDAYQGYVFSNQKAKIIGASGAAMIFNREKLENIRYKNEYFDENLHYKNDIDLSLRLKLQGIDCKFISDAVMYHDRGLGKKMKKSYFMKKNSLLGHKIIFNKFFNYDLPILIIIKSLFYYFIRNFLNIFYGNIGKYKSLEKDILSKVEALPHAQIKKNFFTDIEFKKSKYKELRQGYNFTKGDSNIVSFIIVNYYKAKKVIDNVEYILRQKIDKKIEILILDNSVSEKEKEILLSLEKLVNSHIDIKIFISPKNIGYTKANNILAEKSHGGFLVFINPDILINDNNLLSKLIDSKNDNIAIIAPKQVVENKNTEELTARKFPNLFLQILRRSIFMKINFINSFVENKESCCKKYNDKVTEVDWLQSSFFLVLKKDFFTLGLFSEDYFLFMADTEICLRVWQTGKTVVINRNLQVFSDGKRCSRGSLLDFFKKKIIRIHLLDALKFYIKNGFFIRK